MLTGLLSQLGTKIFGGLSLVLAAALLGAILQGQVYKHRAEREATAKVQEIMAHQATKDHYRAAVAEADAKALLAKQTEEKRFAALQKENDDALHAAYVRGDANGRAWFNAHRVQSRPDGSAASGAGGGGLLPGPSETAGSGDGADRPTDLATITRADFQACDRAITRLIAIQAWATGLAPVRAEPSGP